jgi:hypothetical protein
LRYRIFTAYSLVIFDFPRFRSGIKKKSNLAAKNAGIHPIPFRLSCDLGFGWLWLPRLFRLTSNRGVKIESNQREPIEIPPKVWDANYSPRIFSRVNFQRKIP